MLEDNDCQEIPEIRDINQRVAQEKTVTSLKGFTNWFKFYFLGYILVSEQK